MSSYCEKQTSISCTIISTNRKIHQNKNQLINNSGYLINKMPISFENDKKIFVENPTYDEMREKYENIYILLELFSIVTLCFDFGINILLAKKNGWTLVSKSFAIAIALQNSNESMKIAWIFSMRLNFFCSRLLFLSHAYPDGIVREKKRYIYVSFLAKVHHHELWDECFHLIEFNRLLFR